MNYKRMLCIQEELTQMSLTLPRVTSPTNIPNAIINDVPKKTPNITIRTSISNRSISASLPDILTESVVVQVPKSKLDVAFKQEHAVSPATPFAGAILPGNMALNIPGPSNALDNQSQASSLNKAHGWINGILGCLKPVWNIIGKNAANENKTDDWEIPFENIRDLQWLGSGAQGAVFLGKLNNEYVAVKKVKEKNETDIKHLRRLNHPNIVLFRGVCTEAPNCYCIVMEYCPGGQLYDLLKGGHQVPPKLVVDWSKQIASGMQYLHSHKIIHRDLKSPNVLISHNNLLKISDFGTSRQWNERSTRMSFAGTVAWMAPEIIRNEPCSEKVDVW